MGQSDDERIRQLLDRIYVGFLRNWLRDGDVSGLDHGWVDGGAGPDLLDVPGARRRLREWRWQVLQWQQGARPTPEPIPDAIRRALKRPKAQPVYPTRRPKKPKIELGDYSPIMSAAQPSDVTWWRALRDTGQDSLAAENLIATRCMIRGWYRTHLEQLLAAGTSLSAARRALSRRGIYSRVQP